MRRLSVRMLRPYENTPHDKKPVALHHISPWHCARLSSDYSEVHQPRGHCHIKSLSQSQSRSVKSDSLWSLGRYSPRNSPSQNRWVAFPFSRGSSQPRDWTQVSRMQVDSLPAEPQVKHKNTGVGSLSLLQQIFLTQGLNQGLLHCRWNLYQLSYEGSSSESRLVMSDSLWPHELYGPWNSPGQNTGVGSLSLLQGIFPTQGLNPGLPHCRLILYHLSHKGSLGQTILHCCDVVLCMAGCPGASLVSPL